MLVAILAEATAQAFRGSPQTYLRKRATRQAGPPLTYVAHWPVWHDGAEYPSATIRAASAIIDQPVSRIKIKIAQKRRKKNK